MADESGCQPQTVPTHSSDAKLTIPARLRWTEDRLGWKPCRAAIASYLAASFYTFQSFARFLLSCRILVLGSLQVASSQLVEAYRSVPPGLEARRTIPIEPAHGFARTKRRGSLSRLAQVGGMS